MHMIKNIRVQFLMATKHCNTNGDRIKVIHVVIIIIIIIYSQYWNSSNSTRQNIGKKTKKKPSRNRYKRQIRSGTYSTDIADKIGKYH